MPSGHCSRGVLLAWMIGISLGVAAQQPVPPPLPADASSFTVFLRTVPIGGEQIAVTRTPSGWTVASAGRLGAPLEVTTRRAEFHYTEDWKPVSASIDGTIRGQAQTLRTVIAGSEARNDIVAGRPDTSKN